MIALLPPTRLRRWALALLLAPAAGCMADPEDDLGEDEASRLAGTVELGEPQTLLVRDPIDSMQRGSATLIAPNVVVTTAHISSGEAAGMVLQRGTQTDADVDPLQVLEALPHPDYATAGDGNDIALLRLGCNITDITPAKINRAPLASADVGASITGVSYGPDTKRSMGDQLTGYSDDWIWVSDVTTSPDDTGGSLYGFSHGLVDAPSEGDDDADVPPIYDDTSAQGPTSAGLGASPGTGSFVSPQRTLLGVMAFDSGKSVRVDTHAEWIDGVVSTWADPSLPDCGDEAVE